MTELARLQKAMAAWLRHRSGEAPTLIRGDHKADARVRLELYVQAYRLRLAQALATHYPGLQGLMGKAAFYQLALDYLDAHPSTFRSIRHFGHHLPRFLATHPVHAGHPEQAEMAAFEWAQAEVFDAADAPALDEVALARIPPERWGFLRFDLAPAMTTLDLRWNVVEQWQALRRQEAPPPAQQTELPTRWLVWRQGLDPAWRPLEVDEAWALEQARGGADFATLCEGLLEWVDPAHAPLRAAGFLKTWLAHGLITRVALAQA